MQVRRRGRVLHLDLDHHTPTQRDRQMQTRNFFQ